MTSWGGQVPLVQGATGIPVGTAVPQATFIVRVPDGMVSGQVFQAQAPDGQILQVVLPEGFCAGSQLSVAYQPRVVQPQQQMMGQPGGTSLNYMPFQMGGVPDPFGILGRLKQVKIKQQIQWAQVIVGFDMPNKYIISDADTGHDLFVAAERNDGVIGVLGRQVMEGNQRPFNLDIALLQPNAPPIHFVRLERPFKCTCLCCQRPEMTIFNVLTSQRIASTVEPFSCCHLRLGMRDAGENDVLSINHHCCDCSLLCWGCPCGCQETDFQVRDGDTTVGHIRRQFNTAQMIGMVTGVNADSDQFQVNFEQVQSPEWKAVLIATAIFLDYCYFTKGGQSAREDSALGRLAQNNQGVDNALGPTAGLFGGRDTN
eukprot:gnl/TRDRNA2_/TRDRNA2_80246_c0_seq1.p1 gnl/TRDRNA2_/TRDRNA2_80246_c0~~gnl/TRDRNA2_/TRDRNA2_80246_c0_seq1.p1  ORF type:complete len:399 (-),score=55.61 gnl/TRDRNA2_/TRDRNA2_80246_c0_seq1:104-1216(-)